MKTVLEPLDAGPPGPPGPRRGSHPARMTGTLPFARGSVPARRRLPGNLAWLTVAMLGLGLGLGSIADAQPRRGDGSGASAPPATERREQIKKKIRAIRAYKLTEDLALDEQTAGRLFPVLSHYDDEIDKLLEKRVDVNHRLRRADTLNDPKAVERLLDEAVANQRGFAEVQDKRIADLRRVLTPVQAAKLLVVLPDLERQIQRQLRKAIVQQRNAAGSAGDTDDDQESDERATPPPPRPPRRREAPPGARGAPSNAPGNTPPCNPNTEPCR
jgi:hypothetical protein